MINRVALFVVFAVAAGAATVALAGQPGPGQPRSLDDVQLELGSHGRTLRLVPQSFCASANEEPIALACGGVPIFHRRQGSLLVHRGTRMQLRFGAPVGRAYMTVKRPTRNGRLVELSRELPLERTSDPRIWRMRVPVPRGRRVIGVLAIYRDPVRLRLPGRLSAPFENASGEFDVYVRRHRHRARQSWALGVPKRRNDNHSSASARAAVCRRRLEEGGRVVTITDGGGSDDHAGRVEYSTGRETITAR